MSVHEEHIQHAVEQVEALAKLSYLIAFHDKSKPPAVDQFKASFMAEVARRVRARAVKIEEDWEHFTR
jgi:hypothetical protein